MLFFTYQGWLYVVLSITNQERLYVVFYHSVGMTLPTRANFIVVSSLPTRTDSIVVLFIIY